MKSIRGKILLTFIVTVLAALLAVGGFSIYVNYSSTMDLLEQTMTETAEIAAERVEKELDIYRKVASEVGSIARLAKPEIPVAEKKSIMDQRVRDHGFQRGNIIGADGISIFDGKDYSDREYVKSAMNGNTAVSEPLISKITGELSIMVSAPLWEDGNPGTKVVGVVYFVPKETFLNDIVTSIQVSPTGAAYMLNANGDTIADVNMDVVMNENIEEDAKSNKGLEVLAAIHKKMRAGEKGFGQYTFKGTSKYVGYSPIGGTDGWSLAVTAHTSDFIGSTLISIWLTVALLVISLIAASIIAVKLSKGIGDPIGKCTKRIQLLAEGNLEAEVYMVDGRDEVAQLSRATKTIVEAMKGIIKDIDYGLGELANGNYTASSRNPELYIGDFRPLMESMLNIIDKNTAMMRNIGQSADQVASGSDQVAAGSQALSQGATEQASAVEELAATINDISSQVSQMAERAKVVRQQTGTTDDEVMSCNGQMEEMIRSMGEIADKSGEIGKIIKTIEDIAFQTNILALNAAVEAARAGEAGKGFAVVADEVRNLANKSQEASKNTSVLIEGSLAAVKEGTVIANDTADSLARVVESVRSVTEEINQISQAAEDQAMSIAQVTQGIDQISSVVQTNSATAEESAAASEELSGQAQVLKDLVGQFRLNPVGMSAGAVEETYKVENRKPQAASVPVPSNGSKY